MAPMHRTRSGGDSCSCSTCVYKSETDHPSLSRIADRGSRIDRLYFGKYIPLREGKLLERLVRTRAVYDGIRAKLISDSTISLTTKGDSNTRREGSVKALDNTDKSGVAVLEIVNMVDRGAMGSTKLDDCCSCCSCASNMKIYDRAIKKNNKKRPYAVTNENEARERVRVFQERRVALNKKKAVRFKTKFIKSDPCTCTYKLIRKHSKVIYNKMHQHPRLPLPRFELHPTTAEGFKQKRARVDELVRQSKEKMAERIQKIRNSQTQIQDKFKLHTKASLEKLIEAKNNLKLKVRDGVQKIKEIRYKGINESQKPSEEEIQVKKDSVSKLKEEQIKRQIMKDWECEPECLEDICEPQECLDKLALKRLKKNISSILDQKKFNHIGISYSIKTQDRKAGKPLRQTQSKIQAQKLAIVKNMKTQKAPFVTQTTQAVNGPLLSFDKSRKHKKLQKVEGVHTKEVANIVKIIPTTTPHKISVGKLQVDHSHKKGKLVYVKEEKTNAMKIIPTTKAETISVEKFKINSPKFEEKNSCERQTVRIGSSFSFDIEFYKSKPGPKMSTVNTRPSTSSKLDLDVHKKHMKRKKRHWHHRDSQTKFKKSIRDTQTDGRALKRCFCTLKLKAKNTKKSKRTQNTKNIMTVEKSTSNLNSVAVNKSRLHLYNCEPGVCRPGDCNPYECIKFKDERKAKLKDSSVQARKIKSSSSFTSLSNVPAKEKYRKSLEKRKPITHARENVISITSSQTEQGGDVIAKPQKQAVRVGSTFSFNMEFYRHNPQIDKQNTRLTKLPKKPKQRENEHVRVKDRGYQGNVQNTFRNTRTQIIKKERNARIGNNLRRCFCTLKLQNNKITKKIRNLNFTTGTDTAELLPIILANKSSTAGTKSSLLSYECEPGVCVPGNCTPYECLQLINIKDDNITKSTSSQAHKTKSTSSYISKSEKSTKTMNVKSLIAPANDAVKPALEIRKYVTNKNVISFSNKPVERVEYDNKPQRQAVRVGSTFSFNIEFYKDNPHIEQQITKPSVFKSLTVKRKPQEKKKVKIKNRGYQGFVKNSPAIAQTQKVKKQRNSRIGTMRRCFCTSNLQNKEGTIEITKETTGTETVKLVPIIPANINSASRIKSSLLPYECEPGVCVPGDCNPYKCIQLINLRKAKQKSTSSQARKTKSSSSYSSRYYIPAKAKYVQSMITPPGNASYKLLKEKRQIKRVKTASHKQAVRVGSTFSFNIEICKNSPYTEQQITKAAQLPKLSLKPKLKEFQRAKLKDRGFQGSVKNIRSNFSAQIIKKERNVRIGTTLRRCFCTLKLHKKKNRKSYGKGTYTTGTESSEQVLSDTANKGTKTKSQYPSKLDSYECEPFICDPGACDPYICLKRLNKGKIHLKELDIPFIRQRDQLEPFECEPFTCTPGECDPYVCVERINKRKISFKEAGLTTGNSKTTSSIGDTYPIKSFKTARVQYKPRHYEVSLAKHQKPKKLKKEKDIFSKVLKYKENDDVSRQFSSFKSGQSVKVGSTFSFDIEFFKNHLPTSAVKQIYPYETLNNSEIRRYKKNKEVDMNRLNVAQMNIQVPESKKHDKSSLVGPLLKRCFCTLNFQKKLKGQHSKNNNSRLLLRPPIYPMVYMVNRAIVGDNQSVSHNKYQMPYNFHSKQDTYDIAKPRQSKNTHDINSQLHMLFIKSTSNTKDVSTEFSPSSHTRQTHFNSLSSYIRRCFYVWNLKVENKRNFKEHETAYGSSVKEKKLPLPKLEPYECEPGICIPGECNPYECQKLMLNSTKKTSAMKSGTEHSLYSISTSTGRPISKSKLHKQQTLKQKSKQPQVHRKSLKQNQKQAVRIGSSFSFDIEFFKNLSMPLNNVALRKHSSDTNLVKYNKPKEKHVKHFSKSEGTGKIGKKLDSPSQYTVKTTHKGSYTKPPMKRCFCTLKLQKKGRLYKTINHQLMLPSNDIYKINTVNRGQNTKKYKPKQVTHTLEPYECEPNICIPDQCDPYKCLEILKKRYVHTGENGTNTITQGTKSISSVTTDKKEKKNYAYQKTKDGKYYPKLHDQNSLRKVVRIGSNFSFNIDFFKDQSLPPHKYARKKLKESKYEQENKIINSNIKEPALYSKKLTNQYVQEDKILKHNQSQIKNLVRHASTATNSFIKRCFCTTRFYKSKNVSKNNETKMKTNSSNIDSNIHHNKYISNLLVKSGSTENTPSVLEKCKCILNKMKLSSSRNNNNRIKNTKETQNKKVSTHKKQEKLLYIHKMKNIPQLKPYECIPGICVPDECDPYTCNRIMTKYRTKSLKTSAAETVTARSVSNNSPNIGKKNARTFTNDKKKIIINKPKPKETQSRRKLKRYESINKTRVVREKPNRNVVRIGSNFSFDIEFYKDHSKNDAQKSKLKRMKNNKRIKTNEEFSFIKVNQKPKLRKNNLVKDIESKNKVKINTTSTSPSTMSQSSLVKKSKVKDTSTGINNLLKRCFCTLKLRKKNNGDHKLKQKETDSHSIKNVSLNKGITTEQRENMKFHNDNRLKKKEIYDHSNKNVLLNKGVATEEKHHMFLLPFECEPNVCTPFECNPYECDKLIKLRQKYQGKREFGTSFPISKKVSTPIITDTKKSKTKSQGINSKHLHLRAKKKNQSLRKYSNINEVSHSKQSVRIGSTFSFNINFFKQKNHGELEIQKRPKQMTHDDHHSQDNAQMKVQKKSKDITKKMQVGDKKNIKNQTQHNNQMMRNKSTMTVHFPSKRCFCTLSLKKTNAEPSPIKTLHSSISTETEVWKAPIHPMTNILPYECERNFCVPGECNPIVCLERIKNRQKSFATVTEIPQDKNVATKLIKDNGTKNKKVQMKQLQKSRSKETLILKNDKNNRSQVVRYGSKFSFDIEFFKENYPGHVNSLQKEGEHNKDRKQNKNMNKIQSIKKQQKSNVEFKNQANHNDLHKKKRHSRALQSSSTKMVTHGTGTFLKRCFCTLTLHKKQGNKISKIEMKSESKKISTENKSTTTKEIRMKTHKLSPFECEPFYCVPRQCDPYECKKRISIRDKIMNQIPIENHDLSPFECEPGTCVPGTCNPYECEKRIIMRRAVNKTQNTHHHIQSQKGVGIMEGNVNSAKTQANLPRIDKTMFVSRIDRPEIVEIPRLTNIFNKQAVKIESKFSFNIEFFKENLPQKTVGHKTKNNKQKTFDYDQSRLGNNKKNKMKTKQITHDRDLNTENAEQRSCESECDINKSANKATEAENVLKRCFCTLKLRERNRQSVLFPQTHEVRRVAVQYDPTYLKERTKIEAKSVGTKIDKNHFKSTHINRQCNHKFCQNGKTVDFETILPYVPEKFNNTVSKTSFSLENKYNKPRGSIKNRAKKLTRQRNKSSLNYTQTSVQHNSRIFGFKNFIMCFAQIFYPKSQKYVIKKKHDKKYVKSERQSRLDQSISNFKSKKCQKNCPYYANLVNETKTTPINSFTLSKKNKKTKNETLIQPKTTQQFLKRKIFSDDICICSKKLLKKKQIQYPISLNIEPNIKQQILTESPKQTKKVSFKKQIVKPRSLNFKCPKQTFLYNKKTEDNLSTWRTDRNVKNLVKTDSMSPLKKVRFLKNTKSSYCRPCKGKIMNKVELNKAAGDQLYHRKDSTKREVCFRKKVKEPLFQMHLDAGSYDILNRDQVVRNIKKFNTKCMIKPAIEMQLDAEKLKIINKDLLIPKVIEEIKQKPKKGIIRSVMEYAGISCEKLCPCHKCVCTVHKPLGRTVRKTSGKPCICGSTICAKSVKKTTPHKRHKWKPCSCGSPVCGSESEKIRALTSHVKNKCLCHKEIARREARTRAKRLQKYKRNDAIRNRERRKAQRLMESKIDKKSSDAVLFAENVLDVGKLGITAATDVLRQMCRVASDPKHTYLTLKTLKENPNLIGDFLKSTCKDFGVGSTLKRVRLRCFAMRGVQRMRKILESYAVTRYLLYMTSNDPKRRLLKMKKPKPKPRVRERMDFACSLYMASLRRRPFLAVYDRCAWFYPHFLSMVHAGKQFIDICLYLLAAVVWSPCILCMELCRACMCCLFCTG